MNLINNLKGYYRRLITIRRDKNYKSDLKSYGDISVEYIDSIIINSSEYKSNIVIKIQYSNEEGSKENLDELINLIAKSNLRIILIADKHEAYVYGGGPSCAKFLFCNENLKSYNKFFSLMYNLYTQIDTVDTIFKYLKDQDDNIYQTEHYYPYESDDINLSLTMPVYVRDITAKLPEDERSACKDMNTLFIYDTDQADGSVYKYYTDDIKPDSILQSKDGDSVLKYSAPDWIEEYASNLTLYDGTNILKDNLLITNNDDQALYDNIDEIID